MKREIAFSAVLAFAVVGIAFSGTAQSLEGGNTLDTDDETQNASSDITVGVNSKTQIDVKPGEMNWPNMDVGTQNDTAVGPSGANTFGSIEISNIGSEYIDRIWVNATAQDSDPFGTGNPGNYDAGNFLQVKPSNNTGKSSIVGNTSTYHYVNRYEFNTEAGNDGEYPSYIEADASNLDSTTQDSYVGRFRSGDEWYFYAISTGSDAQCNGGAGDDYIRIGNTRHSPDQFGTVDFTENGPGDWTQYNITNTNGEYGLVSDSPDGEIGVRLEFSDSEGNPIYREYDVLTACEVSQGGSTFSEDAPHTIRTRYNVQAGDVPDLTVAASGDTAGERTQFLLRGSSPEGTLLPGEGIAIDTAVEVPQGVPEGGVQDGQVTFFVTSDYDSDVTS
jgi:hypothetical protein